MRRVIWTLLVLLSAGSAAAQSVPTIEYYHTDAVGSVRAVTDQTGAVVRRHDYFPFGEEFAAQPGSDPRRFTGKERDAETGLDYFGARYYASRTGRFTTVDPLITLEENLVDPQRWNRYAYVRNNPLRYTDPDGRAIETIADIGFVLYDLFDIARSVVRGEGVTGTQVGALGADVLGAVVPFATGGGIAVRAATHADDIVDAGRAVERTTNAVVPYARPSGATTKAQRASVQGKPCVDCGTTTGRQVADHKKPLVKEHYETGSIDKKRMRDPNAVQPQCPTCSAKQGAELSRYSREQRKKLIDEPK
jgi:RHS repeat-associated protein